MYAVQVYVRHLRESFVAAIICAEGEAQYTERPPLPFQLDLLLAVHSTILEVILPLCVRII
jgi:hypothetical protein